MKIVAKAPAKINLAISIKGKRYDNYHEVDMVMQTVSLFDIITVERNFSINGDCNTEIICNRSIGCSTKENTVFKASEKFFKYTNIKNPGILIKIQKNIPTFAGLAGGSSDAAAVLVCLNKIFDTKLSDSEMIDIGAEIGADVPFFIVGGTCHAYGIGTEIEKIKNIPDCGIVIVKPECNISTKKAYDMYDDLNIQTGGSVENMINFINVSNLFKISRYLFNDFEQIIKNSEIEKVKNEFLKTNAMGFSMSGSGPSVYAIFENFFEAQKCAKNISKIFKNVWVCMPFQQGVHIFCI